MPVPKKQWPGRVGLPALLALIVFLALPALQRSDTRPPLGASNLTTVLAALSRSIPQESGPSPQSVSARLAQFNSRTMPKMAMDALRAQQLRINSRAEVQVYILMNAVTDANIQNLRANGVTIQIPDAAHGRVQASVPVTRLQAVAGLPFVNFLRTPTYAVHMTGSVDTEGDVIHRAEQTRQQFIVDGTGIRVGVISDGIRGIFDTNCTTCSYLAGGPMDPANGDLPFATGVRNTFGILTSSSGGITGTTFTGTNDLEGNIPGCGFAGAGAEGSALLEIVHDIAPGAQLSFANADTDIAFNQAVSKLASTNDVVVDDLAFIGLAADGTSDVSTNTANVLNSSANPIRAYVTSAGNAATGHYYGMYSDSGVNGTTISGISKGGDMQMFQQSSDTTDVLALGPKPYDLIRLPAGGEAVIILNWDDRFGSSGNNYDLYLVRESTGNVVAQSTDTQNGSQDPLEIIDYINDTGADDNFHVIIQNVGNNAAAKHLNLYSFEPECATGGPKLLAAPRHERLNYNTATRSVPAQSDAGGSPASVISVGAICSASARAQTVFSGSAAPDESCMDTTNSTIEYFSSQGPTLDGRNKPDISAVDGVSITGAGSFENPFFGTSAAAPHVAGIAALVLQSKQCLLTGVPGALDAATARTNLRSLLLDNALPLPSSGSTPNNVFGAGLADAFAATNATIPTYSGPSILYVPANSLGGAALSNVDPSALGFAQPEACPMVTLSWTGDCGAGQSSGIICGFGTKNVTVKASNNNGLTYSPEVSLQLVVTNFSVTAASPGTQTVRAGLSASYTIFATSEGGPYNSPVTFTCSGLPSGSACTFNPAQITPGATSASTTLSIATTGRAFAPPAFGVPPGTLNPQNLPWLGILPALVSMVSTLVIAIRKAKSPRMRNLASVFVLVLAMAFLLIQPGCGGGTAVSPPPVPTPAGSYQITVTGTAGTLTQTVVVTLAVQ